jgi:hypothetical protein
MFALPALFRLFSGPCQEISFTELPRKKKKGRFRRSHYGCYPVHLTSSQKIKRAMSFALLIALCCSSPVMAASKKTTQSWQAQCLKDERGLATCCESKAAECRDKGGTEKSCLAQKKLCVTRHSRFLIKTGQQRIQERIDLAKRRIKEAKK